jgi:hypothetical protein
MPSKNSNDDPSLCAFTYSDNRRCRMLRSSRRSKFCFYHARKLRHFQEADDAAADLFDPISGGFITATALSQSVSRLFAAVAEGRLDPRRANALARVAAILLKTISVSTNEFRDTFKQAYWTQLVRESCGHLPEYVPPPLPARQPAPSPSQRSEPPKPPNPELPKTIDEFMKKVGIAAD